MRFFRTIHRIVCLAVALLVFISAGAAEEAYEIGNEGLDLTETISVHYPVVSGGTDEALTEQINTLIREKCRIEYYLTRMVSLLSGGSLEVEWKGGILGDVFSSAVSADGAVESSRPGYEWTAVSVDLRDGHEITFAELFTDEVAARETIEAYLEETVAPDLNAYLQSGEVTPLPDHFWLEQTGLTLLYPVEQLSTLSDRAGDIRIGWNVLKDVLDMSENSIPVRIGLLDAVTLTAQGAEKLRTAAAEGVMTDIPAKIGDSIQELTDRYHQRMDWDGIENGRLFALEGGCFRGVYLITDNLTKGWENSVVQGIRMDQGCLWGLCPGETLRTEWLEVLGEPDGTVEVSEESAEANRLIPGNCDYYHCGDYLLQLYSDEEGALVSVMLTE
uniref:Uncharacterized protein n=1 Tax=uncultured bacterium Contig1495 TaxID=1393440 RepID=W0FIW7_9BACT|nr:hypothetical protein [uncultured bacterium Contig1495]